MIGIVAKPHQGWSVEEFFQLFKTPWEFCREGASYDVVITTTGGIPSVEARLLVVSGPDGSAADGADGIVRTGRRRGGVLEYRGTRVPLYGDVIRLRTGSAAADHGPSDDRGPVVMATGARVHLGYDLFDETALLLGRGQPREHAGIPALDAHIALLRDTMLRAGIAVVEIPPIPAGHTCTVCLTHDVDFAGIRHHRFDHTMWGFLYRATLGAVTRFARGRISVATLLRSWAAAATLPLVHAGLAADFWDPFRWYRAAEHGLPATYFLIPFKGRRGERVPGRRASRRAAAYDVAELRSSTARLVQARCEVAVHGIDAWHSVERARAERRRVREAGAPDRPGMRVHWLLHDDATTPRVLEDAGYDYDSTLGYNDTVGFRNGTAQVFRPPGARTLLELPLHIQDGALFFPHTLDLSDAEAWTRCMALLDHVTTSGGVLTLLWHDRSHGPERFWGAFYLHLLHALKARGVWFATAADAVGWFRTRRRVAFDRPAGAQGVRIRGGAAAPDHPALRLRVSRLDAGHRVQIVDVPWTGGDDVDLARLLPGQTCAAAPPPVPA